MGNNVTKTRVETVNIDQSIDDSNDNHVGQSIHKTDDIDSEEQLDSDQQIPIEYQQTQEQWDYYNQEYEDINTYAETYEESDTIVTNYEDNDVLNAMKAKSVSHDFHSNMRTSINIIENHERGHSLPLVVRTIDDNNKEIVEIDDLQSIDSGSKLTLNDAKSDTEDVIQELNKLNIDLDEREGKYLHSYRKRGQSWSNWENGSHVELKAESSLSNFSRPASINESTALKTKSYTAPEGRGQMDSAIEWLAKQQGLEMTSALEYERQRPIDSTNSRHTLRLSSVEIPGSVSSSSSQTPQTPAITENEMNLKYDDLDQQIISSIENEFIR